MSSVFHLDQSAGACVSAYLRTCEAQALKEEVGVIMVACVRDKKEMKLFSAHFSFQIYPKGTIITLSKLAGGSESPVQNECI